MIDFNEAELVKHYRLSNTPGLFEKIKNSEAMKRPDAIRAVLGTRICWFVPVEFDIEEDDDEKGIQESNM